MKERPMLFNGAMVRAILDGSKTQTRRAICPYPELTDGSGFKWKKAMYGRGADHAETLRNLARNCPYGKPGDRIWVRERTRVIRKCRPGHAPQCEVVYEADGEHRNVLYPSRLAPMPIGKCIPNGCHREASRITLEIVSVRVERLTCITEEDSKAEGARKDVYYKGASKEPNSHVMAYEQLWDSIAGEGSFHENPWVWVVEFKRI